MEPALSAGRALPLQVAVELEESQEYERRKSSIQLQELQQQLSSLELERMQSQLACLRIEDDLNESRQQRAELAKRLAVAEERLALVMAERDEAKARLKLRRKSELFPNTPNSALSSSLTQAPISRRHKHPAATCGPGS